MKKQDIMTSIGMLAGIICVVYGIMIGGSGSIGQRVMIFFDLGSIFITVGGSFAALLINYPLTQLKKMIKVNMEAYREHTMEGEEIIGDFINLSRKARREGLLSLEDGISDINDDFLKKGLQMVIDGIEPETIREVMELEIDEMERRHRQGAEMFKSWAAYAPAFGMIGTLIGLIQMLANLSDSASLASGMAKALITTFYGSLMANLIFNPIAANLNYKTDIEVAGREMMLEGILAIQSGVNPRIVQEKLISYLSPDERSKFNETQALGDEVVENV
ncbi:motility protein A [Haloimpatiens lingqiaonensis]|uniref:motility protein A n=1 Tax=Haloimpatiens lingqiaonensis TaxID=1380675 RepID=UPI0010FE70D3|nr:MotA/TolQ/ExbB proton channel family protein [Haloimpatiens lingqiaonensis]